MAQATVRVKRMQTPSTRDPLAALIAANNKIKHYSVAVNPGSHAANTTVSTSVTLSGVASGDLVVAVPPNALEDGILVQSCRATGANTVTLKTRNATAGVIDPASATWDFVVIQNDQILAST